MGRRYIYRWYWPWAIALFWIWMMGAFGCAAKPAPDLPSLSEANAKDDALHTHSREVSLALLFPSHIDDDFLICLEPAHPQTDQQTPACKTLGELRRLYFGRPQWAD